jgi:preprotein translocase subunit SecG
MNIFIGFLLVVHVITCVLLILIVLMQRPKSEGLGTAFGGGVADSLFGSGAGNVLTKITTWLGIIFFGTTISLALLYGRHGPKKDLSKVLQPVEAPATATNAPAIPPSSPIIPSTPSAPVTPVPAPKTPEKAPEPAKPADQKPK